MERIAIFGSSGHAAVVIDAVVKQGLYEIVGLIDSFAPADREVLGYRIIGRDDDLAALVQAHRIEGAVVAIGDNAIRWRVVASASTAHPALRFVTVIHPAATIGTGATIGPGTIVVAGAVVGPRTTIGSHCLINTGAQVDHDCTVEDFVSVAPAAVTGGNCRIGTGAAIGIGAVVIHNREIGAHSVIGAGAVVLHDIPTSVVAYGVPAREVRTRQPGDRYL